MDVNEVIREMIVLLRNEAARYAVAIRTNLAADLPQVMADRVQLQQVFMNLISNAIEAMESVVDRERLLTIRSDMQDGSGILITVEDTGSGIDAKNADRIFETFFTTKHTGMGMGLAISRSIIETHHGRL